MGEADLDTGEILKESELEPKPTYGPFVMQIGAENVPIDKQGDVYSLNFDRNQLIVCDGNGSGKHADRIGAEKTIKELISVGNTKRLEPYCVLTNRGEKLKIEAQGSTFAYVWTKESDGKTKLDLPHSVSDSDGDYKKTTANYTNPIVSFMIVTDGGLQLLGRNDFMGIIDPKFDSYKLGKRILKIGEKFSEEGSAQRLNEYVEKLRLILQDTEANPNHYLLPYVDFVNLTEKRLGLTKTASEEIALEHIKPIISLLQKIEAEDVQRIIYLAQLNLINSEKKKGMGVHDDSTLVFGSIIEGKFATSISPKEEFRLEDGVSKDLMLTDEEVKEIIEKLPEIDESIDDTRYDSTGMVWDRVMALPLSSGRMVAVRRPDNVTLDKVEEDIKEKELALKKKNIRFAPSTKIGDYLVNIWIKDDFGSKVTHAAKTVTNNLMEDKGIAMDNFGDNLACSKDYGVVIFDVLSCQET